MKKIMSVTVVLICLAFVAPSTSEAQKPKAKEKSKSASCAPCHADFSSILPKNHKQVKGVDISACTACHKPDFSGKAEPNPYSASLHRSHVKPGVKADCTLCHTWVPGKTLNVKNTKLGIGPVSKSQMAFAKKIFASWASSPYLDALHGKGGIVCLSCHGKTLPKEGDTVENDRCLTCHGSMETLAKKTEPKDFPDRNPHKSHLGEIACTVCHKAHSPSQVYCLSCHKKFTMKISGG
jgi:hypothetical protein